MTKTLCQIFLVGAGVQSLDILQKLHLGMGNHAWCLIVGDLALWAESLPKTSAPTPLPHLLSLLQP